MFWDALWKLLITVLVLPCVITVIWLLTYQFCSAWMPDALAGVFAQGIIWGRNTKPTILVITAISLSVFVSVLLWNYLWFWTILIGAVLVGVVWFFGQDE